ncbi:MAG: replication-relaxation family protein [Chloroflexi bacterium]|nr:replication-relaxation family protein [Chloroflexota bacterium]
METAEGRGAELRSFLGAVWRHPWARFDFLRIESGLSEFKARRARREAVREGLIDMMRIATMGQARPPARYSLTAAGACRIRAPLPAVDRRAAALLAAPHLERVRGVFLEAPSIRGRLEWSISPWRAGGGMTLDGLACMRNSRGREVLVAFAVPPEGAAASWWYVELLRSWFHNRRAGQDADVVLAVLGHPFDLMAMPMLARTGRHSKNGKVALRTPVYFLPTGEESTGLGRPDAWLRLPELGLAGVCPWDEPTHRISQAPPAAFVGGRVPKLRHSRSMLKWADESRHPVASALRAALPMTHGEMSVLGALLQYPAFSAEELAQLVSLRARSIRRCLEDLQDKGLVETLPLFEGEKRSVLTARGLDLVAFMSMQTPTRFRTRRAWSADYAPLTRSPRHMQYILAFMFALRRDGRLARWDLVHARYEYCVAIAPGDLTRPRRVELVPDSGGILTVDGREVPFWLEIDRGTRHGVRLTRQLEKYILARFGYAATDPLPMLLYVVAEGGESRARLVARRLVELSTRYRLRRIPAILITTWELLTGGDRSRPPEPMGAVWRLPFRWMEYVLPVPPLPDAHCASEKPDPAIARSPIVLRGWRRPTVPGRFVARA